MEKVDLKSLNLFITNGDTEGYEYETVNTGFDISPTEFLNFAEHDLTAQYDHHIVNSLSNTKRAIDSQLDSLLIGFGLSRRARDWSFPRKIDFLNSIGIISPNILKKINKKRNLLEHEYKKPNTEEVEDALDVAELFVNYTNKYLSPALVSCILHDKKMMYDGYPDDVKTVIITLDWDSSKIVFDTPFKRDDGLWGHTIEEVNANETEYDEYLKIFLSVYNIARL